VTLPARKGLESRGPSGNIKTARATSGDLAGEGVDEELFLRGGKHKAMLVRNAVRVNRKSGQLTTLAWLLTDNKDGENSLAEENMQLLPDGYREKYNPSIRYDQFMLGFPKSDDVIARREISQGKPVPFTRALRRLAARKTYTREEALELEETLRAAASAARKP
jgi:hypothetical protein